MNLIDIDGSWAIGLLLWLLVPFVFFIPFLLFAFLLEMVRYNIDRTSFMNVVTQLALASQNLLFFEIKALAVYSACLAKENKKQRVNMNRKLLG